MGYPPLIYLISSTSSFSLIYHIYVHLLGHYLLVSIILLLPHTNIMFRYLDNVSINATIISIMKYIFRNYGIHDTLFRDHSLRISVEINLLDQPSFIIDFM